MASRVFKMITISRDLKDFYPINVSGVRLFNFVDGKIDLKMDGQSRNRIGTVENCWIRIYDTESRYYDFIASEVYFDFNERGLFLLVSEETEFISVEKISEMVKAFLAEVRRESVSMGSFLDSYATQVYSKIRASSRELSKLHSLVRVNSFSRLDIEDTFEYSRSKLMRKYLLNLIASKIIKENRQAVLELVS